MKEILFPESERLNTSIEWVEPRLKRRLRHPLWKEIMDDVSYQMINKVQ